MEGATAEEPPPVVLGPGATTPFIPPTPPRVLVPGRDLVNLAANKGWRAVAKEIRQVRGEAGDILLADERLHDRGLGGLSFPVEVRGFAKRWFASHSAAIAMRLTEDGVAATIMGDPEADFAAQILAVSCVDRRGRVRGDMLPVSGPAMTRSWTSEATFDVTGLERCWADEGSHLLLHSVAEDPVALLGGQPEAVVARADED